MEPCDWWCDWEGKGNDGRSRKKEGTNEDGRKEHGADDENVLRMRDEAVCFMLLERGDDEVRRKWGKMEIFLNFACLERRENI